MLTVKITKGKQYSLFPFVSESQRGKYVLDTPPPCDDKAIVSSTIDSSTESVTQLLEVRFVTEDDDLWVKVEVES